MRQTIAGILAPRADPGPVATVFRFILIAVILISVAGAVLSTEQTIYWPHRRVFWMVEIVSLIFFVLEYLARIWIAPDALDLPDHPVRARLKWMFSFDGLIDFLAISPGLLEFFFPTEVRLLRLLRLLRVLKVLRYSSSFRILFDVIHAERRSITAAMSVLLVLVLFAASGAFFFERVAQPEHFGSVPKAMWWAVVTLTTVGYGDVYPITMGGKFFGALMTLLGIGMAALPAGILASGFSDHMRIRRENAESAYFDMVRAGQLDPSDPKTVAKARRRLGISRPKAQELEMSALRARTCSSHEEICPTCGQQQERL